MNIYNIVVERNTGERISIGEYKNKVMLIVNTATKCGFTGQYKQLQELYEKYKDRGLVVLDFPCNQFANQAKGSDKEIQEFCSLNYGTTFPRFVKIHVNGEDAHPLFKYLKSKKRGFINKKIKWNFTKFLVDNNGDVIARFSPTAKFEEIEKEIVKLLK